ncbi:hypothetical protein [Brevibacillus sp. SKDU10]|uniref:hypothetical protein n=1 Tax=Brevibacillus sp. SKDU10 TaxID=1247872 RepID=UPI000AD86773|nr:hypothetical protein [Brevibacillus sp. SKDU10]
MNTQKGSQTAQCPFCQEDSIMHDDSELIKLVLQGNQQAFAPIIDKYKVKLYSLMKQSFEKVTSIGRCL